MKTELYSEKEKKQNIKQGLIILSRSLVGIVFLFSGFVKAVDPQGSYIKFVDYFNAFGMQAFEPFALPLAFVLSAAEFITGFALLFNLRSQLFVWLALLFMAVFTPLTFYLALENPVTDCGCFGDAWVITNWETFWKNIVITIFTLITFAFRKENKNWFKPIVANSVVAISIIGIFIFQYYSNEHLPTIDFRPYKIGDNISEGMTMPEDKTPDKFIIIYTLKHQTSGEEKDVDSEKYIETKIWEDTLWQITATSEPILVEEGYHPPIHDFELICAETKEISGYEEGEDITETILTNKGYSVLVITYDIEKANKKQLTRINKLAKELENDKIKFYALTSSLSTVIAKYRIETNPIFSFFSTDAITLKTIVRSNPGMVLLKEGTVIMKWHGNDIPTKKEFNTFLN